MALTQDAVSGLALFYALLAFSSLHRHGINEQAVQLKIQALQFLSAAVTDEPLVLSQAAQHVAASMLLGSFEVSFGEIGAYRMTETLPDHRAQILDPSEASGEWLLHTWGAMDTIQATQIKDQPYESETGHLINWVYYHETISRFTVHHWRHKSLVPTTPVGNCPTTRNIHSPSLTRYRPVCEFLNGCR